MVTAMSLRVVLVMAVVGAAALSACGGTESASPTSSPTLTRITTTEPDDSLSRSPSSKRTTTPSEPTESEVIDELVGFTSPSGNVGCMIDSTFVRCDILERDWSPPPRPADCEFDYGQGIDMAAGEQAEFICAGDTALGGGEPLEYGNAVAAGTLSCDSAESGITCRDSATGHGFTIAREAYRIF
jgi:hypothetical protein